MTKDTLIALVIETIEKSDRNIIGEFIYEMSLAIDDNYEETAEELIQQLTDDLLKIHPELNEDFGIISWEDYFIIRDFLLSKISSST
jgi:hypothetical protein